jgi:hypothetical protein
MVLGFALESDVAAQTVTKTNGGTGTTYTAKMLMATANTSRARMMNTGYRGEGGGGEGVLRGLCKGEGMKGRHEQWLPGPRYHDLQQKQVEERGRGGGVGWQQTGSGMTLQRMNTAALGLGGKLEPKRCSNGSNKHTALPGFFFQLCSSSCEGRGQSEGLDNTDVLF